jgi:hypothetical protein
MVNLIEESMIKRNRRDSLLHVWSKMNEKDELDLFDKHIRSIKDLEFFMVDLNNFLGDILYNCPRGYAQYKEYVAIFNKAAQLARELNLSKEHYELFLKHINKNLSSLPKNNLSLDTVKELYNNLKPNLVRNA